MIKDFRLPVTEEQAIAVIYQKPDDVESEPAPAPKKKGAKPHKFVPKPLIIMMHGFPGGHKSGNGDLFGDLEGRLAQWGYASVRFDFRGCGESDCKPVDFSLESALEDLAAVMQWARQEAGHRQFILLGESIGGTIAIMGHDPRTVQGLALLWPAIVLQDTSFRELFTREARLARDKQDAPYVSYGQYRLGTHFANEIYKTDLTDYLTKISVPVSIQHGTADDAVPLAQAITARDHLKGPVEIAVFEGGGHGLPAANMREPMLLNLRYFMDGIAKKLDLAAQS